MSIRLAMDGDARTSRVDSKIALSRRCRRHVQAELYDDSSGSGGSHAIYGLSDPRDIRLTRYVGQTMSPKRRFMQHLNAANLWMPDDLPWWIKAHKMRPLSHWIRELHADGGRLPVMVISAWAQSALEARTLERGRIFAGLSERLPLLNVETEILGRQIVLI